MEYIIKNVTAILFAAVAGLVSGTLYHAFFFRHGQLAIFFSIRLITIAAIAEFWLAAILAGALIVAPQQADPWVMAIASAVVIWVGFIVPVLAVTHAFRGLSNSAMLLDCAHWLLVMVVQAAVLQAIGFVRPA